MGNTGDSNLKARDAWDTNARFWDEHIGEGNDFFELLVWPSTVQLASVQRGTKVLDVACGNGLTSRRLAAAGATVVAVDFSESLIGLAKARTHNMVVQYRVLDATDYDALLTLGEQEFDGALCSMALMDMADLEPLMRALTRVLRPGAWFVFSVLHPCFNNPATVQVAELEDRGGVFEMTHSVKTSRYMTPFMRMGAAIHGQPEPHPYFHRSLTALLAPALNAGFVLDALVERSFPAGTATGTTPLSWNGNFSEIPPVLIARMRLSARAT